MLRRFAVSRSAACEQRVHYRWDLNGERVERSDSLFLSTGVVSRGAGTGAAGRTAQVGIAAAFTFWAQAGRALALVLGEYILGGHRQGVQAGSTGRKHRQGGQAGSTGREDRLEAQAGSTGRKHRQGGQTGTTDP